MTIVLNGQIRETVSEISQKISQNYAISTDMMDAILQFEYARQLPINNILAENLTKIDAIVSLTKELEGYTLHGDGKPAGKKLPNKSVSNNEQEEHFFCEYYLIFKKPAAIDNTQPLPNCLMVCSTKTGILYYRVENESADQDKSGIDILNEICRCRDGKCGLPDYFKISNIVKIEEENFKKMLLSEVIQDPDALYSTIQKEIIPIVMEDIKNTEKAVQKETHLEHIPYIQ